MNKLTIFTIIICLGLTRAIIENSPTLNHDPLGGREDVGPQPAYLYHKGYVQCYDSNDKLTLKLKENRSNVKKIPVDNIFWSSDVAFASYRSDLYQMDCNYPTDNYFDLKTGLRVQLIKQ